MVLTRPSLSRSLRSNRFRFYRSPEPERASFSSQLVNIFKNGAPGAKLVRISLPHLSESGHHSFLWMDFFIQPSSVQADIELLAVTRIEVRRS